MPPKYIFFVVPDSILKSVKSTLASVAILDHSLLC